MEASTISLVGGDRHGEEIRPYRIHVSSKYLDLTRKKLELTRLPHELELPPAREWETGTPKSEIEPLIDFWLETYSWRTQETHLNNTLPQFRTAIQIDDAVPLRIHFLHLHSTHENATPLLLLPPFPLTNLSLRPSLWNALLSPPPHQQAFHIIIPCIPGLGFSDALPSQLSHSPLASTAALFNALMLRLQYTHYIVSATSSGSDSPANIDHYLPLFLAQNHPNNCLAAHLIAPPLVEPTIRQPWQWAKFHLARFFHASIFNYTHGDFTALRRLESSRPGKSEKWKPLFARAPSQGCGYGTVGTLGLREPNTLAYALCDSPVGLLSLVCSALRQRNANHGLAREEVLDVCQLAWLPGPEAALRVWGDGMREIDELRARKTRCRRERVGVSVFEDEESYACPAWIVGGCELVWKSIVKGTAGLACWEREDVVVQGVRGLAEAVGKGDDRLVRRELRGVVIDSKESVVVEDDFELQLDVESPDTVVAMPSTPRLME